jgi:hypothetical protein
MSIATANGTDRTSRMAPYPWMIDQRTSGLPNEAVVLAIR